MWFNNNFLRVMLLGTHPGHFRIEFGKTITPDFNSTTTRLADIVGTNAAPFNLGGTMDQTYTVNDNTSGNFRFATNAVGVVLDKATAKEMAIFYHGYIPNDDGVVEEQQIPFYYEIFDEDITGLDFGDVATAYSLNILNYVRAFNPEESLKFVPVGLSGKDGILSTSYLTAKLVMSTAGFATPITLAVPRYMGDRTYELTTAMWHQGTPDQLHGYPSWWEQASANAENMQFRLNEDGTVTFKIRVPLDKTTGGLANAGRIYFTSGYSRFDILLASMGFSTVGNNDQLAQTSYFATEAGKRECIEFNFTLGESVNNYTYNKDGLKLPDPALYKVTFRKAGSQFFTRNGNDANGNPLWQAWPLATSNINASNFNVAIPRSVIAPLISTYSGTNMSVKATHKETGVVLYDVRNSAVNQAVGIGGLVGGEYAFEATKTMWEGCPGGMWAISPSLLERNRIDVQKTDIQLPISAEILDTVKIRKDGLFVPFTEETQFITQFGSKVSRTGNVLTYQAELSTGAYSGRMDNFEIEKDGAVDRIEIPVQLIEPEIEIDYQLHQGAVKTKYHSTETARNLRPDYAYQTEGRYPFTVAVDTVNDLKVKNNLAYACRVDLFDDKENLIDTRTLSASVLPESVGLFEELLPGKYIIVYTSIGMDLENDKRPYITATWTIRRYDSLMVTAQSANPVFTLLKDDENFKEFDVYFRWYNGLSKHTGARIFNLKSGRLNVSAAGLVTFNPTINSVMNSIEDFTFAIDIHSLDGRVVRHRQFRVLIHPDIDIPSMPFVVAMESLDVKPTGDGKWEITPTVKVYPESREYDPPQLHVVGGKTGSEVVYSEVGDKYSVIVDRPYALQHSVLVSVKEKGKTVARGTARTAQFNKSAYQFTDADFRIVNVDCTSSESVPLIHETVNLDKEDFVGRPVWSVVGNPDGVAVREDGRVYIAAGTTKPFKVRMYLKGIWKEQWLTVFPPVTSCKMVIPEGPFYPGDPIVLGHSYQPPEALDNVDPVYVIADYPNNGKIVGNVLTFNDNMGGGRLQIRMTFRGKTDTQYITCAKRPDPEP